MKLLAVAALMLLAPGPDIRFENDGLRVGDALVQGSVLELRGSASGALLASGTALEALTSSLQVDLGSGRILTLEPGVRVTRVETGYRFSAHQERRLRLVAGSEVVVAAGAIVATPTAEGWTIGDRTVAGLALQAGQQNQDDTDANLERMKQSAERMKTGQVPKLSTRKLRRYKGDPVTPFHAGNTIGVRQIPQVSPNGAP